MSQDDSHLKERSHVVSSDPHEVQHFDSLHDKLINMCYGGGLTNMVVTIQRRDTQHFQIVVQIKNADTGEIVYDNLNAEEYDDAPIGESSDVAN